MEKLEIIHVRLAGASPRHIVADISGSVVDQPAGALVRIYQRVQVPTDLAVHISLGEVSHGARPDALGVHLADALREHGSVNHTIWLEVGRELDR